MATEFRLNYTGSEINRKLQTVDETKSNLENNYYTSNDIDTKFEEVNTFIGDIETSLEIKADLVDGKIPASQLPDDIGGGGGTQVQPDHAQNDDTQPDYIKNRIAYSNGTKNIGVLSSQTFTFMYNPDMGIYMAMIEGLSDDDMLTWKNLGGITVTWDGVAYECPKKSYMGMNCWGNSAYLGLESSGEPFVIAVDSYEGVLMFLSLTDPTPDDPENAPTIDHTIEVSYEDNDIYTDSKYFNIDRILTVNKGDALFDKAQIIFEIDPDQGMGCVDAEGLLFLPNTKNIKVFWDSVEYVCEVQYIEEMYAIGNIGMMTEGEITGEPFIIASDNSSSYMIYSLDTNPIHEVYIIADDEFKKKIDSDYVNIKLEYDYEPTHDSENLLTSGDIYRALGYRSSISVNNEVNDYSDNPVSARAVYNALGERTTLVITDDISAYSSALPTSQAVYNAIENKKINIDSSIQSGSTNAVSGGAVYTKLTNDYYTKAEIDTSLENVSVDLSGYYTKEEVDGLLGDINTILDEIDALMGE